MLCGPCAGDQQPTSLCSLDHSLAVRSHRLRLATMAPKSKAGDKGKSKDAGAEKGGGKQKGAQSINVRHILCEKVQPRQLYA